MTYRIGFDGVASAEVTHMLRAVQNGLNGRGAGMLMHIRAEEDSTSAASAPCDPRIQDCGHTKGPTEPPHIIVVTAIVVVASLIIGLAIGYRLGVLSVNAQAKS